MPRTRRNPGRPREAALPPLLPAPRSAQRRPGSWRLSGAVPVVLGADSSDADFAAARALADGVESRCGVSLPLETHADRERLGPHLELRRDAAAFENEEGYRLCIGHSGGELVGAGRAALRHGVETLLQLVTPQGRLPACEIEDAPDFRYRGVMLDVSRGKVPSAETLRELVDLCVRLKLNVLMLYVEHTFRFRRHPKIGQDCSPLDAETLRALDIYADERGVELLPCLQSLGHMEHILALPEYAGLAETDLGWTLSPADEGSYTLLRDLYAEFLPNFRSKRFNANCDEPWDLERGRSAALAARRGPGGVFVDHVTRIRELAAEHGKQSMIWADVVHARPERIPELPRDAILLDWWYEAELDYDRVRVFAEHGFEFWVCPGTSSWNSLFPRLENSCKNVERWAAAGRRHGASGLLNTDWGDFGHYNLQGNSFHSYAWGAQQAWSGERDPADFDRAFARAVFGDASGRSARCYRELGAIHDPGFAVFNGSPLQYLFFDDVEAATFVSQAKPAALRRCERQLLAVRKRLAAATEDFGSHESALHELDYAADASLFAVNKAAAGLEYLDWRRQPKRWRAKERRALARRFRDLADAQAALARRLRQLWLKRSHISEFEGTRRRLSRSLRAMRAAARRLETDRPNPAPATEALTPQRVIAAVRAQLR